jgi:LPPG:FO 2-phospho-L-lactate transferase
MIVVLTGGTGGAKFVQGLQKIAAPKEVTYIVNTGDDLRWWGLHVSPDVDSILYALAGKLSRERGWGVEGDTFHCLETMRQLGQPAWFQLGDRDLATHLLRTRLLSQGFTLAEATAEIAQRLGIESRVLVMSNERVETRVQTASGELSFQEYFVRERYAVEARGVRFDGTEQAKPAPGVVEGIMKAEQIIIAPSNPVTSIGPILAVPGIRRALQQTAATIAAISPIIGDGAVSGPAAALMKTQGWPVSIAGVAHAYRDFLDVLICDVRDAGRKHDVEQLGIAVRCTQTLMRSDADKQELARFALEAMQNTAVAAS